MNITQYKEKNPMKCLTAKANRRIIIPVGSLAQLVEQLTLNQLVAGSNPARPTNKLRNINKLQNPQLKLPTVVATKWRQKSVVMAIF